MKLSIRSSFSFLTSWKLFLIWLFTLGMLLEITWCKNLARKNKELSIDEMITLSG